MIMKLFISSEKQLDYLWLGLLMQQIIDFLKSLKNLNLPKKA